MYRTIPVISGVLIVTSCISESGNTKKPNILFIMADDHTTQAISCYKGILEKYAGTVNIDLLASEGIRFTNCFCTNSISSPSRATILTGKYSHKHGVYCLGQPFDSTQLTSATVLQEQGYQTAVFGKWHLKSTPAGFDDYKVMKVQGRYRDPQFIEKGIDSMITRKGWSTDVITDLTIDFITNRNKNKPFYVLCHYKATHDPWDSRPPYDTLWEKTDLPEPQTLFDEYQDRSKAVQRTTLKLELINQETYPHKRLKEAGWKEQREYIYQQYIKSFLRCGKVLDENVGRLLDYLDKEKLDANTVVFYTADQGHFLGEHGFFSKRFMYEESMRMPLIIRYPGKVLPGSVNNELVANIDFAPTIIALAGVAIPDEIQGISLLPMLYGDKSRCQHDAIYYRYWQHLLHRNVTAHYGIRTKKYKLIYYNGQSHGLTDFEDTEPEWELFDLQKDSIEMVNCYNDSMYNQVINELKQNLSQLRIYYQDCLD
jgi:arylsulfatase A-like enzyme